MRTIVNRVKNNKMTKRIVNQFTELLQLYQAPSTRCSTQIRLHRCKIRQFRANAVRRQSLLSKGGQSLSISWRLVDSNMIRQWHRCPVYLSVVAEKQHRSTKMPKEYNAILALTQASAMSSQDRKNSVPLCTFLLSIQVGRFFS